jgi:hypothetical protein
MAYVSMSLKTQIKIVEMLSKSRSLMDRKVSPGLNLPSILPEIPLAIRSGRQHSYWGNECATSFLGLVFGKHNAGRQTKLCFYF